MISRVVLFGLAAVAWSAAAQVPTRSEPVIKKTVIEDDQVRIEELRVRGQLQRITVSPKASGVQPYQIVPPEGRDLSQQSKGISGQRMWQFLSF
jgi:hypothetical protein